MADRHPRPHPHLQVLTAARPKAHAAYLEPLVRGDLQGALAALDACREAGWTTERLYLEVLQPAMYEVGDRWARAELTVATEHFCSAATMLALARLQPRPVRRAEGPPVLVAACPGDFHILGAQMLADLLTQAGHEVRFLGSPPVLALAEAARAERAQVVMISWTRLTALPQLREAVAALRAANTCGILVGGQALATFRDANVHDAARLIGADACVRDVAGALAWLDGPKEAAR